MLVLCDNVKSKVWVDTGFVVPELLRASSQHCNNSLTVQATMQRMTLRSKPVEENQDKANKEMFYSSVSRTEGQLIFQRSQKQYVSPQHLEIQVQLYFFFITVANRLLSWFPEHCSPIASQVASLFLVGKKIFWVESGNWRKIRGQHFFKQVQHRNQQKCSHLQKAGFLD